MKRKPPFEKVVAEHGATVLRVCRAVVGPADADDAWSATFLAALRAWPDLPGDANVEAWLVTIAHRKAIDLLRAKRRHGVPSGGVAEAAVVGDELAEGPAAERAVDEGPVDEGPAGEPAAAGPALETSAQETPAEMGSSGLQAHEVWTHVRALPDKQRQVIAYRYLAGLSYAEVAEIVGGTSAAARRAAADGIKTLRARLARADPRGDDR